MNDNRLLLWGSIILVLLILVCFSLFIGLKIGEVTYTFDELWDLLFGKGETLRREIMLKLRFPRVLLGFTVGAALSLSGVILQGLFRNPLVEPYTLGISGGASVGIAFVIACSLERTIGEFTLPIAGFIGALLTVIVVYSIGLRRRQVKIEILLLSGVMISFIASSLMMLLLSLVSTEKIQGILFWTMGGLNETRMSLILFLLLLSIIVFVIAIFHAQILNGMRLGIDRAAQLGINSERSIKVLFIASSLLTGVCVSLVGVIGFVGLIIPQLMRLCVGGDFRILLPTVFLSGGIFLILCDIFARSIIMPNELPIGVVTGIIGGVIFIILMFKLRKKQE